MCNDSGNGGNAEVWARLIHEIIAAWREIITSWPLLLKAAVSVALLLLACTPPVAAAVFVYCVIH